MISSGCCAEEFCNELVRLFLKPDRITRMLVSSKWQGSYPTGVSDFLRNSPSLEASARNGIILTQKTVGTKLASNIVLNPCITDHLRYPVTKRLMSAKSKTASTSRKEESHLVCMKSTRNSDCLLPFVSKTKKPPGLSTDDNPSQR